MNPKEKSILLKDSNSILSLSLQSYSNKNHYQNELHIISICCLYTFIRYYLDIMYNMHFILKPKRGILKGISTLWSYRPSYIRKMHAWIHVKKEHKGITNEQ